MRVSPAPGLTVLAVFHRWSRTPANCSVQRKIEHQGVAGNINPNVHTGFALSGLAELLHNKTARAAARNVRENDDAPPYLEPHLFHCIGRTTRDHTCR